MYVYIYMIEEFECAVLTRVSYQDKCVVLQSNDAYELHVLWKRRVKIHCDFSNSRLHCVPNYYASEFFLNHFKRMILNPQAIP